LPLSKKGKIMGQIIEFKNKFKFLSNFTHSPFTINNYNFSTVEHYYQTLKAKTNKEFLYVFNSPDPKTAKKRGRKVSLRGDWEFVKDYIMYTGVKNKFFNNNHLAESLIETDNLELIEGNYWNDTYWGVCLKTNKGQNKLGKILMCVRDQLKKRN